jgi:hypothetical protein
MCFSLCRCVFPRSALRQVMDGMSVHAPDRAARRGLVASRLFFLFRVWCSSVLLSSSSVCLPVCVCPQGVHARDSQSAAAAPNSPVHHRADGQRQRQRHRHQRRERGLYLLARTRSVGRDASADVSLSFLWCPFCCRVVRLCSSSSSFVCCGQVTEEYRQACMESGMDCFVASQSTDSVLRRRACRPFAARHCVHSLSLFLLLGLSAEPVLIESLVAALEAAYAFHANARASTRPIAPDVPSHPRAPSAISLGSNQEG